MMFIRDGDSTTYLKPPFSPSLLKRSPNRPLHRSPLSRRSYTVTHNMLAEGLPKTAVVAGEREPLRRHFTQLHKWSTTDLRSMFMVLQC